MILRSHQRQPGAVGRHQAGVGRGWCIRFKIIRSEAGGPFKGLTEEISAIQTVWQGPAGEGVLVHGRAFGDRPGPSLAMGLDHPKLSAECRKDFIASERLTSVAIKSFRHSADNF